MYEAKKTMIFGESAFTLRHKRTSTYTFSRAVRFRVQKRPNNSEFISLPSTLDRRGTSQGFGGRWKPGISSRFESPAPGSYDIPTSFNMKIGPKFIKDNQLKNYESIDFTPGPGTYEVAQPIGKHAPKFTFRAKVSREVYSQSPPPNAYAPASLETSAFKNITFGIGERNFLKNFREDSPGPGSYEIQPECFKLPKLI
ncbi:hypothetical protein SteCoe_29865 [Stentor coeruleus]|uniref:Uncharacterized protein n=1 Tax=Stentor coeruleus TaxID=5963 RepID=A0A1R2B5C5_9CILI|nr:hypothetical protein SteCoe_29865 [Stentor coeruleus]